MSNLLKGWRGYAWKDGEYIDDIQKFFDEHPEHICQRCGGPNIVWHAPNVLWNKVVGSPNGILCPLCFVQLAKCAGIDAVWMLHPAAENERVMECKRQS